ncbi:MAG TPA: ATP-binding protein, partial [Rudaea sp.]|nr:ATP-binding protein [Rudaea sp.]
MRSVVSILHGFVCVVLLVLGSTVHGADVNVAVQGPAPIVEQDFRWTAYRRFSGADGLPANTVQTLAQDHDGFVYAGTANGLARYDGKTWKPVELPTPTKSASILKLKATTDGALWIGTDNDGLFRENRDGIKPIPFPDAPAAKDVEALLAVDATTIYAGTSQTLYRCDEKQCREIPAARGLEIAALLDGRCNDRECLWIGTNQDGVYRIDDITSSTPHRADWHLGRRELPAGSVRSLAHWGGAAGNDLWVGTGRGLSRVAGGRITLYTMAGASALSGAMTLAEGRNENGKSVLRFGTPGSGIGEIKVDGTWTVISRANGLPEDYVLDLLQTDNDLHSPILWVAMKDGGVARTDAGTWSTLDERNGLPNHVVRGLGQITLTDGGVRQWIGTSDGAAIWHHQRWESWLPQPLTRLALYDAKNGAAGMLWLGTNDGLVRLAGDASINITARSSPLLGMFAESVLYEPAPTGPGHVWVATHHGLTKLVGDHLERENVDVLSGENPVAALTTTTTRSGRRVWMGGASGIAFYEDGKWHALPDNCAVRNDDVLDLREEGRVDESHGLWVGHRGGVSRIDLDAGDECTEIPASIRAAEPAIQIQLDAKGRIYVFGTQGVTRLTRDPLEPNDLSRLHAERFGLDDGLPTLEFNHTSFVDPSGRVWAGTSQGAVVYDPRDESRPPAARPLRLLSARADGRVTPLTDGSRLRANENNVTFEFSLLSYQREKQTRYHTELDGLGEANKDWTSDNRRTFLRLPPGDYTFHAYARDGFGLEAEPISLHFSITPPLWLRWWALILYAAAALALMLGVGRWRVQRVRRVAAALERTVEERTTALTVANSQLEDARNTAEAATQAKSVFLANMSHEIRTPMNAVLGFAGLGMRLDTSTKARDYFRKINNSGQNLLNILNDILDFSKIEAGKLALETVPFSLSDVLAQVSDLFTIKASEKSLEFVVGTAPNLPDHYVGDPLRLGQVLLNLVNNAIKFTRAGFVQLYAERVDAERANGKILLRFSVEDSGIGMSDEQLTRLFQPFSQADHSTTRTFGGTGLGLTISQRLVAQMGGVITVRSHPGAGSCFHFEIGLKPQAADAPHRLAPDQVRGRRILVVDDSEQARTWLCDQLSALRFNVHCVDSGEAALSVLHAERFDVILMDWMMPGIDGIETTRRIRSDLGLTAIPEVIMVTAHGREAIQDAAESVGVKRFLIKPVDASVLLDTIVDVLGADIMR